MWTDWLVSCDYGFSVSALWCILVTPTVLLGFVLPWTWGISSRLLQQSAAIAPYLGRGPPSCLWMLGGQGQWPRDATPCPRSGAAAKRSYPTFKEQRLRGHRRAERSYSLSPQIKITCGTFSLQLILLQWRSYIFNFLKIYYYYYYFTLQYCIGFAIHQHASTMGVHMSPSWIPLPPPSPYHPSGSS